MSGVFEQKKRRGTETDTHKEENTVQTHTHKRNTPARMEAETGNMYLWAKERWGFQQRQKLKEWHGPDPPLDPRDTLILDSSL